MQRRTISQHAMGARWFPGAALLGLLVAACNPSPHIDPVGGTSGGGNGGGGSDGGTTSPGGSGGSDGGTTSSGGSTPSGCKSNADCSYPENLCDVASGECVECLVTGDCGAKPGTVCSVAACVCPVAGETFCPADGYGPARCRDLDTSGSDCGVCGHQCFGACVSAACADAWEPTALDGAPAARSGHVAVWADSFMIVWGGWNGSTYFGDGASYDLDTRTWTPISSVDAPSPREGAVAVWTGGEMIVWGGRNQSGPLGDGASYNPSTKKWTALPIGGPSPRYQHAAVWTGIPNNRLLVWGGFDGASELDTGASYTEAGGWAPLATVDPPPAQRRLHTAVWDDAKSRAIFFGGYGLDPNSGTITSLSSGGIYGPLPANEKWTDLSQVGSPPAPRHEHSAVWAGTNMIVWGGVNGAIGLLNDGARFDAAGNNEWEMISLEGAPSARRRHSAVFFKNMNRMVIWGGRGSGDVILGDGGLFETATVQWSPTGLPKGPAPSVDHTAVVAGSRMIVWGGLTSGNAPTKQGAILDMAKVP